MRNIFIPIFVLTLLIMIPLTQAQKTDDQRIADIDTKTEEIRDIVDRISLTAKFDMTIGGTDYTLNETSTVFLQLLEDGQPVNDRLCLLDYYDPDKNIVLDDSPMIFLDDGVYFLDFEEDEKGVYIVTVKCSGGSTESQDVFPTSFNITKGQFVSGTIFDVQVDDGDDLTIETDILNDPDNFLDVKFNFTGISSAGDGNATLLWNGKWDGGEPINVSIFNFETSMFELFTNSIPPSGSDIDVNNVISNITPFIDSFSNVTIRFEQLEDNKNKDFETDKLILQIINQTNETVAIPQLRGAGEVHISDFADIPSIDRAPRQVYEFFFLAGVFDKSQEVFLFFDNIFNFLTGRSGGFDIQ